MEWQDIVISVGQWILAAALLPSVFSNDKPALATSILTGSILAVFSFTFYTLNLPGATLSAAAVAILWLILALQRYRINQRINTQPDKRPQNPS
jgi:hypothetical protein